MPKSGAERMKTMREKRRASEEKNEFGNRKKTRTEIDRDSREMSKSFLQASLVENVYNQPSLNESLQYPEYNKFKPAHNIFQKDFVSNKFGSSCSVCDRLWFNSDFKPLSIENKELIQHKFPEFNGDNDLACNCCRQSLRKGNIPKLAKFNSFAYPTIPPHLPKLDLVSERLISPRIPFMQIRRLRHVHGQFGILGQDPKMSLFLKRKK